MTETNRKRAYQPGLEVVPGYTLVRTLGSGMAGDVWVARAAGGTLVAVKIVRSLSKLGGRKEFQSLKTLRNIRHPNLCPVHGFWTKDANGQLLQDGETQSNLPDSRAFIDVKSKETVEPKESMLTETMSVDSISMVTPGTPEPEKSYPKAEELIVVMGLGDCTLHDRLMEVRGAAGIPEKSTGEVCGLEADEVIEYLRAASKAIDELNHQHNIYHCDIKPQNILKVGGGIQVCDFGLANRIEQDVRETQQAFASVAYGAPEVLNDSTYSRSVDQYSLAITYYELRTGVLPFDATTFAKVVVAKLAEEFDMSHVSTAEQRILKKATRKDPKDRYSNCTEFVNALAIASGVEKRSGITPKRAGIAATLALALIGGLIYSLVSRSEAATHIGHAYAAISEIDQKSRSAQADAIVMSLNDIHKANESNPTSDQQAEIKEFAAQWSDQLVLWVLAETNQCVSKDWSNGQLATRVTEAGGADEKSPEQRQVELCRAYLAGIENLYADNAVLDSDSPPATNLRTSVELAHTQLDLITDVNPSDEFVSSLRKTLHKPGLNSSETLSQALTVAVTHHEADGETRVSENEFAIGDIAMAQQAYTNFADQQNDLQPWLLRRWRSTRDRFVAESKRDLESGKASVSLRRTIEEHFPTYAIDALVRDSETQIANNQWKAFQALSGELNGMLANNQDLTAKYGATNETFRLMSRALEDPAGASNAFDQLAMRLIPDSNSGRQREFDERDYSKSVDLWISEIAERLLKNPAQLDFQVAKKIYGSGMLLRPNDGKSALERLIMVAAIRTGPDALKDETFETVLREQIGGDEPFNSLLRAAIRLERDRSARGLPAADLIESLTKKPSQEIKSRRSKLLAMTSRAYMSYLYLLAQHANGSNDTLIWSLFEPSNKYAAGTRETLHPKRRDRIASVLLEKAVTQSGVDNIAVLKQRYLGRDPSRNRVANADWWLQGLKDESSVTGRRLAVEQLLVDVANKQADDTVADQQIVETLQDLIQNPPEEISSLGQFYRAIFEIQLAKCRSAEGQATENDVNDLLRSAVSMANIAFPESFNNNSRVRDRWNQQILAPAMAIVRRFSDRSQAHSGDHPDAADASWVFKIPIDTTIASDFFRFCLAAEDPGQNDVDRLTELEIAASIRASDDRIGDDERVQLLLKCCRFLESQTDEMPSEVVLGYLTSYLDRAAEIEPNNPEVKLNRAVPEMLRAKAKGSPRELDAAIAKMDDAIRVLKTRENKSKDQWIALYNAYWQTANAGVTSAFLETQQIGRKKQILQLAKTHANGAKSLLTQYSLSGDVTSNQTYMVLGNILEDLAHYCGDEFTLTERLRYFTEAEDAFEKAVNSTRNSLKARTSLSRCLYRHALVDLTNTRKWIAKADEQAGDDSVYAKLKDGATPRTRQKWNLWKAQITFDLQQREKAFGYIRAAIAESGDDVSKSDRNAVLLCHATLLTNKDGQGDSDLASRFSEAIELMKGLEDPSWKIILEWCDTLFTGGDRFDPDLIAFVDAIPQSRIAGIRDQPKYVGAQIDRISHYLRQINNDAAKAAISNLLSRASPVADSDDAKLHLRIVDANRYVIEFRSEEDYAKRVRKYLTLFDSFRDYDSPTLTRLHRALLYVCWPEKDLNKRELDQSERDSLGDLLAKLSSQPGNDLGDWEKFNAKAIEFLNR